MGTKLPLVALAHNSENVSVSGVKVSWKVIGEDGQVSCTEYVFNDQEKVTGTSIKVTGIKGETTYYFMVTAVNNYGSRKANNPW